LKILVPFWDFTPPPGMPVAMMKYYFRQNPEYALRPVTPTVTDGARWALFI
jgi:hypothetical protein